MIDAKEFLNEVFMLNIKINAKQREIDILNALLYKVNKELNANKVQSSGSQDPLGDTIAKLIDARVEINNLIDNYVDKLNEVRRVIDCVSDPKEYDLLHKRYIENKNWTEISNEWGESYTWVHKIKNNAIESVQKILDERV